MFSLRVRLPAAMLLLACLAVFAVGLSGYRAVTIWAEEAVRERLGVLAEGRAKALERRWQRLGAELSVQARSAYLVSSLDEIRGWMELPEERRIILGHFQGDGVFDRAERMKRTGFVADALKRHGIEGARVADAG